MVSRIDRISKTLKQRVIYSDFKINLDLNPITSEIELVTNEQAVIQSIRNLVLTYPSERFYQPTIGSTVSRSLFEFVDGFTEDKIKETITTTISNFEPRAQNLQVKVTGYHQQNYINVDIVFSIVSIPNQSFSVPTIVLRIR